MQGALYGPRRVLPSAVIDAVADRVADIVIERLGEELRPAASGWMRTREAAAYLGMTRSALCGRAREIPQYKFDRMLLLKRKDLDTWVTLQGRDFVSRGGRANEKPRREVAGLSTASVPFFETTLGRPADARTRAGILGFG
jgi:hypothetical protein